MIRAKEKLKIDTALTPQAIASTNVTGPYFDLSGYDAALFILTTGAIADGHKATLQIMGNDVAGSSGAAAITGYAAEIEAVNGATIAKVYVNSPDNDDAVTINGVTFTKKAAKDDSKNQFTTVAELVAQINAGVDGVTASVADTNYALVISTNPGDTVITMSTTDSTKLAVSVVAAVGYVDVPALEDFRWVAAKVTTDATITCDVVVIRYDARRLPVTQAVAAEYPTT